MNNFKQLSTISLLIISVFSQLILLNEAMAGSGNSLFKVVDSGNLSLVKKAVESGASVNIKNARDESLLDKIFQTASQENKIRLGEIASYLINQGHDIHRLGRYSTTYLHDAANKDMLPVAALLIKKGIDTSQVTDGKQVNALFYARSKDMLNLLIKNNLGNIKSVTKTGNTLLHFSSVPHANLQYLRYLIKKIPIDTKNNAGNSPLLQLLNADYDPEEIDILIDFYLANRANVNIVDTKQRNALQVALRNKNLLTTTIKRLIKAGANLSHQDMDGIQAIHFSAANNFDLLKLLYSHGIDLNATTGTLNYTPLIIATKNNRKETVKYLLKHKVKLNTQDKTGRAALNHARENDFSDIVMMLEKHKAKATSEESLRMIAVGTKKRQLKEANIKPSNIKTLDSAIKAKNLVKFKKYLSLRINDTNKAPVNLFDIAKKILQYGNLDMFNFIISKGLKITDKDNNGYTLLHYTVYYNHLKIAKFLISNKLDVNAVANDGTSVFIMSANSSLPMINLLTSSNIIINKEKDSDIVNEAIKHSSPDVAEYFIKKGFLFTIDNFKGSSTLVELINNEETKTLSFLIKKGLKVDTLISHNGKKLTMLHLAITLNKQKASDFLIKTGADVNKRDSENIAIFETAITTGNLNILKTIYDHGGLLNDRTEKLKQTPLLVALNQKKVKVVQFYINRGADLTLTDELNKNTPLHIAASNGYLITIKQMIKKGIKNNIVNTNNETPLDLAIKHEQKAVQKYLLSL